MNTSNIVKWLSATVIACNLAGCGTPKCSDKQTLDILQTVLKNYLAPTGDADVMAAFPLTFTQIVTVSHSDNGASCEVEALPAQKADKVHFHIGYSVVKTDDGLIQVKVNALTPVPQ